MKSVLLLATIAITFAASVVAGDVIRYDGPETTLAARQHWAESKSKPPYWLAYSATVLMEPNEFIGSYNANGSNRPTLAEIILDGKIIPPPTSQTRGKGEKVNKQIAFLFLYSKSNNDFDRVEISTMDLHFDAGGFPIVWLGGATTTESIQYLSDQYRKSHDEKRKAQLLEAIGSHKTPEAIPILQSGLQSSSDEVRANAAMWLGFMDNPDALKMLVPFLEKEHSENVINEGLAGINEMDNAEATGRLIDWAENSQNQDLRKQAIFWLGQKAIANIQNKLKGYAFNDNDTEIQKQAVVALAEMEGNAGIPQLIEIAKTHPNPEVRKHAIIFLGESGDPRARQAILDILKSH